MEKWSYFAILREGMYANQCIAVQDISPPEVVIDRAAIPLDLERTVASGEYLPGRSFSALDCQGEVYAMHAFWSWKLRSQILGLQSV